MSGADLQNHEVAAARGRQRTAWIVVLVIIGVLLGVRAMVGSTVQSMDGKGPSREYRGFGLAFVEEKQKAYAPPSEQQLLEYEAKLTDYQAKMEEFKKAKAASNKAQAAKLQEPKRPERPTWKAVPLNDHDKAGVRWTTYAESTPVAYVQAEDKDANQSAIQYSWPRTLGIWIAAFFTLAVLSFLVRDNPAYKFTESVVVGVSAAYWMTVAFWDTLVPKLFGELLPDLVKRYLMPAIEVDSVNWVMLAPLILGILLLCRLNRKASWLGIFPLAFIVGTYAGLRFVNFTESDLLRQIAAMITPLIVIKEGNLAGSVGLSVAAILMFVGVLSVLVYFFFSLEHKGVAGKTARLGIWFLMITFGASFGLTVMGRIALLAARFEFLFDDWLWLVDPSGKH